MLPVHWLAWLLSCVFVSLPVVGWIVLRTGARPRPRVWPLGLAGGVAAAVATIMLEWMIFTPISHLTTGQHPSMSTARYLLVTRWLIGPCEEAGKLALFLLLFGRRLGETGRNPERLVDAALIALGFAAFEEISYVAPNANAAATAVNTVFRQLPGAPAHVWDTLCDAGIVMLARRDPRWLLILPLPALAHSEWDFTFGLAGYPSAPLIQLGIDVITGIVTLLLLGRLTGPVRPRIWRALALGVPVLLIPTFLIAAQEGLLRGHLLTVQLNLPPWVLWVFCTPWLILGLDLINLGRVSRRQRANAGRTTRTRTGSALQPE